MTTADGIVVPMYPLVFAAAAFSAPVPMYADSWINSALDFPKAGVQEGVLVMAAVEITVNPNGYAETCRPYATLGNANMGPYTCRLIQRRALFKPARDASGRRSYGINRIRVNWWNANVAPPGQVPRGDFDVALSEAPEGLKLPATERLQFVVDKGGRILQCGAEGDWKVPSLAGTACASLPQKFPVAAARTRSGKPVASVQDAIVRFSLERR